MEKDRVTQREKESEKEAKEVLKLAVMRNMVDGAQGDIMTLLSANQPLPFCCY